MLRHVGQRLVHLLWVIFGVSVLTFLALNLLPGDSATAILGEDASRQQVEALREELGLDRPLPLRYLEYIGGVLTGDFGSSLRSGEPVLNLIGSRLPVTLQIVAMAMILALVPAVIVAIGAARRPNGVFDRIATASALSGLSIPHFLLGILLILFFSVTLGALPATGWTPLSTSPVDNLRSAILPAVTLAVAEYAVFMRLLRSELIETMREEYIVTAEAKGLSDRQVTWRHALRNSLFPLITVLGLNLGALVGGSVVTETVFAVPGIGRLLVESIQFRDFPVVQGVVLFITIGYVVCNFTVDLLYSVLDPRLRHAATN